jgi:hypothetical protein
VLPRSPVSNVRVSHSFRHVQRELQRARAARRLAPWAAGTALVAAALVAFAGGGARGALVALALGGLLVAFVAVAAVPRCPGCGGGLWERGERPGPAGAPAPTRVERTRRCPRCGATFE